MSYDDYVRSVSPLADREAPQKKRTRQMRLSRDDVEILKHAFRDGATTRQAVKAFGISQRTAQIIRREVFEDRSRFSRREPAPELVQRVMRKETKAVLDPSCIRPIPLSRLMAGRA